LQAVTVSGKLQPTLTIARTAEFSESVRVLATNKGGSTNYVTVTISAACDNTIAVNQVSGPTATLGPLAISPTAADSTVMHGKLATANSVCPITGYVIQTSEGGTWINTERVSLTEATVDGLKQPTLAVKPDSEYI